MKNYLKRVAVLAALLATAVASQAAVITFDQGLDTSNTTYDGTALLVHGDVLVEGDYIVGTVSTKSDAQVGDLVGALVDGTDETNTCWGLVCPTNNSSTFLGMLNDGLPFVQRLDGGGFSMRQFDASFIAAEGDVVPTVAMVLRVYGFVAGVGVTPVVEDFSLPGPVNGLYSFATYAMSAAFAAAEFVEVDFYGYACDAATGSCSRGLDKAQFALDNITFAEAGNNNVPEPGSFALFGLALATLGAVSRRRRLAA